MAKKEKITSDDVMKIKAIGQAIGYSKSNPADREELDNLRKRSTRPPPPVRKLKPDKKLHLNAEKEMARKYRFYKGCFLEMYKNLSALDLTEDTMSRLFGVTTRRLNLKVKSDAESELAYQQAMSELERKMSRMMLVQALGYSYEDEKTIFVKKKNEETEEDEWEAIRKEVSKKHQPGNAQLFIMYMTNKFPDLWKVSKELLTGKIAGYDSNPGKRDRKKITSLARDILEANTDRPETECSFSG